MKEWELLKDLPIEKAGTRIVIKDNDYVVKGTDAPFPYSPLVNDKWFRVVEEDAGGKYTLADMADSFNKGFECYAGIFTRSSVFESLIQTLNKEK